MSQPLQKQRFIIAAVLVVILLLIGLLPHPNPALAHTFVASAKSQHLADACYSDDFDAPPLVSGWTPVDPLGDSTFSISTNTHSLRIAVPDGNHDLDDTVNTNAPRLVQHISGNFDVSTKVTVSPTYTYQSAGILVWIDQANYVWIGRSAFNRVANRYVRNRVHLDRPEVLSITSTTLYFRVARANASFTSYYSLDGVNWIENGSLNYQTVPLTVDVGLFVINQWQNNPISADFDYFHCGASSSAVTPLVFIPGISGSHLAQVGGVIGITNLDLWPGIPSAGIFHERLVLDPENQSPPTILASDAIREVFSPSPPFFSPIYKPLLDELKAPIALGGGGYREYEGSDFLKLTPYERCLQSGSKVNLFVFSYDWRKSNADNATLLRDLVRCIRAIHPNSKVDILTHSMGGLVARRYILDNLELDEQGVHKHYVRKLITIAAPWLGAPKAINVLETGQFDIPPVLVPERTIARIAQFAPGAHELLPSQRYIELAGSAFREKGWDINNDCRSPLDYYNGCHNEDYTSYDMLVSMLNKRYPLSKPGRVEAGSNGRNFHNFSGQDDWSQDQSGVEYHHLYGVLSYAATIARVDAKLWPTCGLSINGMTCKGPLFFDVELRGGDGTVPIASAGRLGNSKDYNAPTATVVRCNNPNPTNKAKEELLYHKDLARNPEIINYVLSILGSFEPTLNDCAIIREGTARTQPAELLQAEPALQPAYYLRVTGAVSVTVTDAFGNGTQPFSDTFGIVPPGVTYNLLGQDAYLIGMPASDAYTVTLRSTLDPMNIALTLGTDTTTSMAVRYLDVTLPANTGMMLKITPQTVETLRYDSDFDGIFDSEVPPTAQISGALANDVDAPVITVSQTGALEDATITLTVVDNAAGVKSVFYSLDGITYIPYTTPIRINTRESPVIYSFAEDNVANRSGLFVYQFITRTYLPYTWR